MRLLHGLNPEQKEAVVYLDGPLLVVAGAGSGKTGVITRKIAFLVEKANYQAKNIYALTFTNKAAREMAERSRVLLGKAARGLNVSTFHRLGLDILLREGGILGLRKGFSVLDGRDGLNILRDLLKSEDMAQLKAVQSRLSLFKNANVDFELLSAQDELDQLALHAFPRYQERLRAYNAVDFDDLLLLPLRLFREHYEVRARWQGRVRYLLVDEYQDTNECQYQLMQVLAGVGAAFTAVGDDDQSIYAWRGAKLQNILNLKEDYPSLKTVKLEQNYRCHQKILHAANALIANNPHVVEKRLWSTLTEGDGVCVLSMSNEEREAECVAHDIAVMRVRHQASPKDFAVLYRSNFQSRVLEQKLRELSIPYKVSGGVSFFEHSEVRDLISYLRLIANFEDDTAFLRVCNVPKREIGEATIAALGEYASFRGQSLAVCSREFALKDRVGTRAFQALEGFAHWLAHMERLAENERPSDVLRQVLEDVAYEDYLYDLHKEPRQVERRMERVGQLLAWIERLQEEKGFERLDQLMQHLMLLDILDRQEKDSDAVQLMTLHSAKGLEFPYVYIVGVEEGLLPHNNSSLDDSGIEEERRLFYVGMTRAKKRLHLSYAKQRKRGGSYEASEASRFLEELPLDGVDWQDGRKPIDKAAQKAQVRETYSDFLKMLQKN